MVNNQEQSNKLLIDINNQSIRGIPPDAMTDEQKRAIQRRIAIGGK